ncbi:MAG: hypothetical protein WA738_20245 [Candidatus Angelobacter sp.]
MADLSRRLTAILTLFLFASSLCFGKGPERRAYDKYKQHDAPMPQEVLSAKTVALVVKIVAGPESNIADYKQRIEADAAAEIQKQNRFQLVSDPEKADLVCMLLEFSYDYWHDAYQPGKGFLGKMHGRTWNTLPPFAIFVFKGGTDPHRTARPVWVKTRIMGVSTAFKAGMNKTPSWMMKEFHAAFANAEKKQGQAKHEEWQGMPPGFARPSALARMPQIGDAERNNPVFCKMNQPCRFPREISSARTVMVCDPIHICNDEFVHQDVIWGGRWKLVNDPAQADLVIILCWTPSNGFDVRNFVYAGLYIFKGGEQPDWDFMPIYLQFGHDHDTVLMDLENMIGAR